MRLCSRQEPSQDWAFRVSVACAQRVAIVGSPVGALRVPVAGERTSALLTLPAVAEDRAALNKARNLKSGSRMSDDSAAALKRKVGGTKGGFFGEQVELKGKYADAGYVSSRPTEVAYAPLLVATLLGVLAILAAVVSRS